MSHRGHLGPQHPLAAVAARLCHDHLGSGSPIRFVGGVGCGACWERAIRADERAVVLFGLPRECPSDPGLVDEVAVGLACGGEPTSLTRAERAEVVRRLVARGEPEWQIAERLRMATRSERVGAAGPVSAGGAPEGTEAA